MSQTRMIELGSKRYWITAYRQGENMQPTYYTTASDERGKGVFTYAVMDAYYYPTAEQALDAAEEYIRAAQYC